MPPFFAESGRATQICIFFKAYVNDNRGTTSAVKVYLLDLVALRIVCKLTCLKIMKAAKIARGLQWARKPAGELLILFSLTSWHFSVKTNCTREHVGHERPYICLMVR